MKLPPLLVACLIAGVTFPFATVAQSSDGPSLLKKAFAFVSADTSKIIISTKTDKSTGRVTQYSKLQADGSRIRRCEMSIPLGQGVATNMKLLIFPNACWDLTDTAAIRMPMFSDLPSTQPNLFEMDKSFIDLTQKANFEPVTEETYQGKKVQRVRWKFTPQQEVEIVKMANAVVDKMNSTTTLDAESQTLVKSKAAAKRQEELTKLRGATYVVLVDKATSLPVYQSVILASGKEEYAMRYESVEVNPSLPATLFQIPSNLEKIEPKNMMEYGLAKMQHDSSMKDLMNKALQDGLPTPKE